jgi:hypothetical protein
MTKRTYESDEIQTILYPDNWTAWSANAQNILRGHEHGPFWEYTLEPFPDGDVDPVTKYHHAKGIVALREMISQPILNKCNPEWSLYEHWQFLKRSYGTGNISHFTNTLRQMLLLPTITHKNPRVILDKWHISATELLDHQDTIKPIDYLKTILCGIFEQFNPGYEVVISQIERDNQMELRDIFELFTTEITKRESIKTQTELRQVFKTSSPFTNKRKAEQSNSNPNKKQRNHDKFEYVKGQYDKWCDTHCWTQSHITSECKNPSTKQFEKPHFNPITKKYSKPQPKPIPQHTNTPHTSMSFMLQFSTSMQIKGWYLDTCGSVSITSHLSALNDVTAIEPFSLKTAAGTPIQANPSTSC